MKKLITSSIAAASMLGFLAQSAYAEITIDPTIPAQLINNKTLDVNNIISFVIGLLVVIGVLAALLYLIYGAIKWIISGGDKTKVTEAREHIVASIIGIVVLVLSLVVLNFILQIVGAVPSGKNIFNGLKIPTLQ